MNDTCKGCRYYECRYGYYPSREPKHYCWLEPEPLVRRQGEGSTTPPRCQHWEAAPVTP